MVVQSRFTATFASQVQVIFLRQPPRHAPSHLVDFVLLVETELHYVGQPGLKLLTSGEPPNSASQSAGITVETGFCHVDQTGLKLLTLGDPLTSASQNARITGMSHRAQPTLFKFPPNFCVSRLARSNPGLAQSVTEVAMLRRQLRQRHSSVAAPTSGQCSKRSSSGRFAVMSTPAFSDMQMKGWSVQKFLGKGW
ncbi:hypothetical protein AAY473_037910 [Plecturocebus cupreus]